MQTQNLEIPVIEEPSVAAQSSQSKCVVQSRQLTSAAFDSQALDSSGNRKYVLVNVSQMTREISIFPPGAAKHDGRLQSRIYHFALAC